MLDDFENNEFAAGDENGREGRPTFAETTAAIARHRKEAERSNFLHGLALAVGGILLVGAFTFLCRYVLQWREARERERLELARELKEADQAQQREFMAHQLKIQEERRKAEEARRAAEQVRLEANRKLREQEQALRENSNLYRRAVNGFRGAKIDYWRNASVADRPDKVTAEAKFLCLVPGGVTGFSIYDVFVRPGQPLVVRELSEKELPKAVEEEKFSGLLKSRPCLCMRNLLENKSLSGEMPTAFFRTPTARPKTASIPEADATFNPSREEFGELYGALKALGNSKLAYTYQINVRIPDCAKELSIRTVRFGEEIGREAFARVIQREFELQQRNVPAKEKRTAVTEALLETTLKKATVLIKVKR